jgi:hypothetical protein
MQLYKYSELFSSTCQTWGFSILDEYPSITLKYNDGLVDFICRYEYVICIPLVGAISVRTVV